jgi:hypothetical protein
MPIENRNLTKGTKLMGREPRVAALEELAKVKK